MRGRDGICREGRAEVSLTMRSQSGTASGLLMARAAPWRQYKASGAVLKRNPESSAASEPAAPEPMVLTPAEPIGGDEGEDHGGVGYCPPDDVEC